MIHWTFAKQKQSGPRKKHACRQVGGEIKNKQISSNPNCNLQHVVYFLRELYKNYFYIKVIKDFKAYNLVRMSFILLFV